MTDVAGISADIETADDGVGVEAEGPSSSLAEHHSILSASMRCAAAGRRQLRHHRLLTQPTQLLLDPSLAR